jgi:hypothetical protein
VLKDFFKIFSRSIGSEKRMSFLKVMALLGAVTFFVGCGRAEKSCDSKDGREAIIEEVDLALNDANCAAAIDAISPYYEKEGCATNEIRLARASAYACKAGLNFFTLISDLKDADLGGTTGFFNTLTSFYPSSTSDGKVTAGSLALDSLFAIQNSGAVSSAAELMNASTYHPGTLIPGNRTQDANIYGMLTSMAVLGAIHNRHGTPNSSNAITVKLGSGGSGSGWQSAANMTSDGCVYAGTLLTFVDSVNEVANLLSERFGSGTASSLIDIATALPLDTACAAGCTGASGSGCSLTCTKCPDALRSRTGCATSSTTDELSCAAAGIVKTVNALYGL